MTARPTTPLILGRQRDFVTGRRHGSDGLCQRVGLRRLTHIRELRLPSLATLACDLVNPDKFDLLQGSQRLGLAEFFEHPEAQPAWKYLG